MNDRGPVNGGRPAVETDRDAGLQPERTRLAWRRTTLSFAVTAVLAMRLALHGSGDRAVPALAVALAALAFSAFLWVANRRMQRLLPARPTSMPPGTAVAVAGCTVGLAVFGAALLR